MNTQLIQDKISHGLLVKNYTAIFVNPNGRVFGYFKGQDEKAILFVNEFHYTILIELSENEDVFFENAKEVNEKILSENEELGCLGIYLGYYEGEFEHEIFEITEEDLK